ncbi:MAG: hypothetical protein EOO38_11045 [Cytophagaceae bacterium]|nr:MAG: hypothetical protein EOO38_11045 [Cytophagaceae bacterium]
MLIHEFTHTLVFLDELNHGHFDYENLTKRKFWATSSILKRERPMDKVVHSILVSFEILSARKEYFGPAAGPLIHPSDEALRENLKISIDSVLEHPLLSQVCKQRTIDLVKMVKEKLALGANS